jgi:hypothetical protein
MQLHRQQDKHMLSKCPACGSLNVRRSSLRPTELTGRPRVRSPYRCRDCGERFWVISRRANYAVVAVAAVLVAGTLAWNVRSATQTTNRVQERRTTDEVTYREIASRAEHDDAGAQFQLSHMYATGHGVEASKKEAWSWLERAAQNGNTQAQYELGYAFREGSGVVQDYATAANWLRLAAESGHADAQYALAEMYRAGTGILASNIKAYVWFNLAAAQDVPGAAVKRDALLRVLLPAEVVDAQAEARRISEVIAQQSARKP